MRTKISFPILIILLFSGCTIVEIPKEMMQLDQAYVPVWLASESNDLPLAADRLEALEYKWRDFIFKYNDFLDANEDNRETFRLLQEWFQDLNYCLKKNDELCIRVKLDQFKFELQELRTFWDVNYTLDYVWDMEASVAQLLEITHDPKLQLLEWNEFMPYVKALNESWLRLLGHRPDVEFLEWDKQKIKNYTRLIKDLNERVDCLNGLTEGAQMGEIAACSTELHLQIKEMITLFGNFPPALEMNL